MAAVAASDQYRLVWVRGSAPNEAGGVVDIEWKGFAFERDVTWELRRLVLGLIGDHLKVFRLHRIVKNQREAWHSFCQLFDRNLEDIVLPSSRAAAHGEAEDYLNGMVQDEWTLTTSGLVITLLFWSAKRHRVEERGRSSGMLLAFLLQMRLGDVEAAVLEDRVALSATFCRCEPLQDGFCTHLAEVLAARSRGKVDSASSIARLARNLTARAEVCLACKAMLVSLVEKVARRIVQSLRDPEAHPMDLLKMSHVAFNKRKLRADHDYKEYIVVEQVKKRRTHLGRQGLRAAEEFDPQSASGWERERLKSYMAAGWRAFGSDQASVFFVTEDASRVGQPPEETQIYTLWHGSSMKGAYLPPQVQVYCATMGVFGGCRGSGMGRWKLFANARN